MTGLNKIIDKISQDSVAKCESIISDARNEAAKILNAAVLSAKDETVNIIGEANAKAKTILEMADSGAQFTIRKELLAAKIEILDNAIEAAAKKIKELPDDE
ncbi:MAG: hypothetical protein LBH71_04255, partial [Oscillospiraceae bacterium]|nr:hypothetical protein [Oscillospiraceae bacterium]